MLVQFFSPLYLAQAEKKDQTNASIHRQSVLHGVVSMIEADPLLLTLCRT
jgi:hypothetical protein